MFSEQPFYIVVTDEHNKVCIYIPSISSFLPWPCLWMYECRVNSSSQMTWQTGPASSWMTSVGSPVSVVVANPVMKDVDQEALSTFHTPPQFWRRYVNDMCTAFPSELVDSFHDHLNSIDPCIQFMMEKESDGQPPFLDILLSREEDGSISTSVHRTATHTDQYLCFHSHHPTAHKQAVVRTLMCRAEALSSSGVSRAQEEKLVPQALQGNGYPKGFIHKHTCQSLFGGLHGTR